MSKYLHFGHVSPIWLALQAREASAKQDDIESFVEELVVRRELSMNFVFYNNDYDSYSNLPGWARKTLEEHKGDERDHTYTRKQLENAETHDEYWNAAMKEMVHTGYMHNYMRMYWGKKILEWSNTPGARLQDHALPQQQVLPRRPRPQLVRQRRLGLRPARPGLDRTRGLRQGPLHVRGRSGAQDEARAIRREGREEDRSFGLIPGLRHILPPARLGGQRQDRGVARRDR